MDKKMTTMASEAGFSLSALVPGGDRMDHAHLFNR